MSNEAEETVQTAAGKPRYDQRLVRLFPVPWTFDMSTQITPPKRREATVYAADSTLICRTNGEQAEELARLITESVNHCLSNPKTRHERLMKITVPQESATEMEVTVEPAAGRSELSASACSQPIWLRTKTEPRFYVHEVRGCCFVSFVGEADKANAACFPVDKAPAETWRSVIGSVAGMELEAVAPFV